MNKKIIQNKTDTDNLIPMTSTLCNNCVFAQYKNDKQTGCIAGRLDHFTQANIPIGEMKYEDTGTTSFVIEGKVCVYYRNEEWVRETYPNKSVNDIQDIVKTQLNIPYHAIVFFRQTDTMEDLDLRLSELHNQKVKPKIVTVVDRSHTVENLSTKIMNLCKKHSFAYWRVQRVQAVDQIDTDVIDLVFDSTKNKPYMFYITFECKYPIPISMSEDIHKSLHDDMKSFSVLLPNTNNVGGAALKIAHQKHAGNSFGVSLEAKIRHYDDAPHLIKKVEEICTSLKMY